MIVVGRHREILGEARLQDGADGEDLGRFGLESGVATRLRAKLRLVVSIIPRGAAGSLDDGIRASAGIRNAREAVCKPLVEVADGRGAEPGGVGAAEGDVPD